MEIKEIIKEYETVIKIVDTNARNTDGRAYGGVIRSVKGKLQEHILKNMDDYCYKLSVDKQVFIDGEFVLGVECKSYTENAMLKRILVDFRLLKTKFPYLKCYLFQLESQLGGDFSDLPEKMFGSGATHTLLSYFKDIDLKVFTLLKGERLVDKPIHKNFKPLSETQVKKAVEIIICELRNFV